MTANETLNNEGTMESSRYEMIRQPGWHSDKDDEMVHKWRNDDDDDARFFSLYQHKTLIASSRKLSRHSSSESNF